MEADEIEEFRRVTLDLIERELDPLAQQIEDDDEMPPQALRKMADLGYFGLTIPVEYGGLGLSGAEYLSLARVLGRTHSAFYQHIDDNNGIGSYLISTQAAEHIRARVLPEMASGEAIVCFALTEPEAGSDAGSIRTVASQDGDSYVLNGTKHFISNAGVAKYIVVIARTRPWGEPDGAITAFLVEQGTPGLEVGRRQPMMGLRGAHQHEVHFSECRIPIENRLGDVGAGFRAAKGALAGGRLNVAAWSLGAAERALELGIEYACVRQQFGRPIGGFQGVQWLIADSATELQAAQALLESVARAVDAGTARSRDSAAVKLFVTEAAGRTVDRMLQIFGGAGYCKDLPIERIYRDLRVQRIFEGTSEIQRMIVATSLLHDAGFSGAGRS